MLNEILIDMRPEILLRIGLTLAAGFILGIERERHGRAAGLRTTLLVSLSACAVMIISDSFYVKSLALIGSAPAWHPDPARLAAGALSGMGFLGAGVIIRQTKIRSDDLECFLAVESDMCGIAAIVPIGKATVVGLKVGHQCQKTAGL